jgi:hypothetical protein
MLGMKKYPKKYVDGCRSRVDADLAAYRNLVTATSKQTTASTTRRNSARGVFQAAFFSDQLLLLDYYFVHRLRTMEGKDGNPLNEVRILCTSILENNHVMVTDKSIKYSPEQSVLKYRVGDEIQLNEGDFLLISKAFFAEIRRKYL